MNWLLLTAFVAVLGIAKAMPKDTDTVVEETFTKGDNRDRSDTEDQQFHCEGECVPYNECVNIPFEDEFLSYRPPLKLTCEKVLDTCCLPINKIKPPPDNNGISTGGTGGGDHAGNGSQNASGQGGGQGGDHGSDHPISCGLRNPEGLDFRIVGDAKGDALFGELPWMTAILQIETLGHHISYDIFKCGGSLIHPQVVLTAAHCVFDAPFGLKIRVGDWDRTTESETLPHQERNVERVFVHPDFRNGTLYNDFALLVLDTPVRLAENVQTVCLPPPGTAVDQGRCLASGWGQIANNKEKEYEDILKKVELPLVPRPECLERLRKTRLGKYFELHESFMCAGGEIGADTCKGDGGGPLVCPIIGHPTHYQQVGIVAWGIGCGETNPAVYANVSYAREWIDKKMKILGFDISTSVRH